MTPNELERKEIARLVAEYLERGGRITVLPTFDSTDKIRCAVDSNASTGPND